MAMKPNGTRYDAVDDLMDPFLLLPREPEGCRAVRAHRPGCGGGQCRWAFYGKARFALGIGVMLWGACGISAETSASDYPYVLRDGSSVLMRKSSDELGVVFRSKGVISAAKSRLESGGRCHLVDLAPAPHSRAKLLRFTRGGRLSAADVRKDRAVEHVGAVYRFPGSDIPAFTSGRLVVKIQHGLTDAERRRLWTDHQLVEIRAMHGLPDVFLVRPAVAGMDEARLAFDVSMDDRALWSNPDFRRLTQRRQVAPLDQFFNLQWHLNNTGQAGGAVDADIDAPEAWEQATGAGVLFGMFDDSCDVDHEDLRDNYIGVGQDVSFPIFDPLYNDPRPKAVEDGHGTAVMGLAVATANSIGVRGVAYQAKFTATRGLGAPLVTDSDIASAYTFALDQKVDIHINSWGIIGSPPDPPVLVEAIDKAFREGRDPDGPGGQDPMGMVIVFASGNDNTEVTEGFELSQLPQVIAVGATTDRDLRASFSNWGTRVNILAPGGQGQNLGITTTDTEDRPGQATQGFNDNGNAVQPGFTFVIGQDIDPNGAYTGFFGGTSAACPIAAGVAGLVLSVNPSLSATDVRILLEHSTDKVSPGDAAYDGITNRSVKYGYGRINALKAVQAAKVTLDNGGLTWPDVPTNVTTDGSTLSWTVGAGTDDYLILETAGDFDLVPADGDCFDNAQLGCGGAALQTVPSGARVIFVGCSGGCVPGSTQSVPIERPLIGAKLFAIYGRNSTTGRYSFGSTGEAKSAQPPSVTVTASPLTGRSPLTVQFNGNAVSEFAIDPNGIEWDFDTTNILKDDVTVNARTQSATFTYFVPAGVTETFTARLTMRDVEGIAGMREIRITVVGADIPNDASILGNDVSIVIGLPGAPGTTVSSGPSPLAVELRIESNTPASVLSVDWDLGDGTATQGLVVSHTYVHSDPTPRTFAITANVKTVSATGSIFSNTATKFLTVQPGMQVVDPGEPNLPGTTPLGSGGFATPCGVIGMIPLLLTALTLTLIRRRRT